MIMNAEQPQENDPGCARLREENGLLRRRLESLEQLVTPALGRAGRRTPLRPTASIAVASPELAE